MSKSINSFQVLDHGVQHEQYFQGCGTAFTPFESVATGIGESPYDAMEDALEQLAHEWEIDSVGNTLSKKSQLPESENNEGESAEGVYHYVSVRVTQEKDVFWA